jgi:uncharacterized RDD family membrane protein YckC
MDAASFAAPPVTGGGNEMQYGGFWRRVAAALIDGILLGILTGILTSQMDRGTASSISTIVGWLYYAGMESSSRQSTLGKSLMGMFVTDLNGQRISFLRATGRHFAKILSALLLFIGFIMVAFDARKQGLHDKLAGTLVCVR